VLHKASDWFFIKQKLMNGIAYSRSLVKIHPDKKGLADQVLLRHKAPDAAV
jgi:hypothetical protein